jgi:hypothetical protein
VTADATAAAVKPSEPVMHLHTHRLITDTVHIYTPSIVIYAVETRVK